MTQNRAAVITIEVLIALIIMFSAIVLTTSSVRSLNLFLLKKEHYENSYITVLSIKALLENRELMIDGGEIKGKLNGYEYKVIYKPKQSRRSFVAGETVATTGYFGRNLIILFDCKLVLLSINSSKEYLFEITRYKKIEDEIND